MPEQLPVALVTGASSGMGREIARDLSRTHHVIAVGRDRVRLGEVAAETGATAWDCDITDSQRLGERIATLSRLDVLVHAAAIAHSLGVAQATESDWETHFAVNVTAPATITRLTLPLLRTSQGTIVFIGSGASTKPVPGSAVYSASKHALRAVADVLRIDEEPNRVRVATVAPGQTDTAMLRSTIPAEQYSPEQYIKPESVAAAVRFVVDAPADVQLTDIAVRPRQEISRL
ncbi:SDR family oxidoreductase [Leucobacter sp. cx-42]|uniref:SDR family oxidoreductase n=1 Tax=unclassified Leucobacter TaxID=2621730 RepID=UPI00165DC9B8|nr:MULTISPECIES: SDR family oxidoreductase [unclassified Leucobacter]MBC9954030.1 SDR family oxidoreductase [Leucobacter sp. cx-42]